MEIKGILKAKSPTQVVNEKFSKREFVLTTEADGKYPQHISFQCTQDKCSLLDKFNEGQELTVYFNLRGREWSGPQGIKYFNTIEAWRIEGKSASATPSAPSFNPQDSDLPF
jgi:hypothetical protein